MKSERNNFMPQMTPFPQGGMMPTNMMMFPNYMNDNSSLDSRISMLEKKVKVLENRVSRLEGPYQNNNAQNYMQNQGQNQNMNTPYQTTQNNNSYNGEMYMM